MITVESKSSGIDELKKLVAKIEDNSVLVGIPEEESERDQNGSSDGINNAELAFIHSNGARSESMINEMDKTGLPFSKAFQAYIAANGSPLWRIPPRPFLEPALEDEGNRKLIDEQFEKVAKAFLESEEDGFRELEKLGLLAQGLVRDWFYNPSNNWPPLAESTLKAKEKKGSTDPTPLIDKGELRNAINYVIRKE